MCRPESFLSPAAAGSCRFQIPTPPSPHIKKKRGTQTGLKLCLPYGPLNGNEPGIFFRKKHWGSGGGFCRVRCSQTVKRKGHEEKFKEFLVQEEGIEPSRIKDPPDFESGASASSATPARR
jgi:hypothetical protein